MREDWTQRSLRSLVVHTIGGTWGKDPGQSDVDVVSFGTRAFASGAQFLDPSSGTLRSVSWKQYADRRLLAGDLVVEVSGGSDKQPVGRTLFVRSDAPHVIPSSFMRLMRFDPEEVDPWWVRLLMQNLYGQGVTAKLQSNTTSIRNLNTSGLLDVEVAVPPMPEQRRIVDLIGTLDDVIAAAETRPARLAYDAFLAVCAARPEAVSLSAALRLKNASQAVLPGDRYRIIGVLRSGEGFIDRGEIQGRDTGYARLFQVGPNELVYRKLTAWEGPISVSTHAEAGGWVSPEFPIFTIDESMLRPGLLRHFCRWPGFWQRIGDRLVGSVQRRKRLNPDALLGIELPMPALGVQDSWLETLDAMWHELSVASTTLSRLQALRSHLLSALISGEHVIPESYDQVLGVAS